MKNILILCLLLAGCQSKNKQQSSVTINGKQYTDSVAADSAGNQVRSGTGRADVKVSGSGNTVEIK